MRTVMLFLMLMLSATASAHHWVVDAYEEEQRVTVEVVVEEFRFIYPHPFITARIIQVPETLVGYTAKDEDLWDIEMDNRRELIALGFNESTFEPGDRITVTVDPSPFKRNTLYARVIEHPADGYRYVHNHRQLYPIESPPLPPR